MTDVDTTRRGSLRVYLGAAPGVGKTFAMLDEGRRRVARGTDVVVAVVETHGRPHTAEQLEGLEVVPRRSGEMDLDAVLARAPEVALVDELAHAGAPGSRHGQRWQDVEVLLAAGVDVVTTVGIQDLESLVDVVGGITGIRPEGTVPDRVVRAADQVELVDMSPEALRRRLAHGNVYGPEQVDAALTHYFRLGTLTALRELALLWVADRVDEALEGYRERHGVDRVRPARERILVAVDGGPGSETLLRRGARLASQGSGSDLLVVHVSRPDGPGGPSPVDLARTRALAEQLGARWHVVVGDDVPAAVLDLARGVHATQVVLGAGRRGRVATALTPGVGRQVVRAADDVDVHLVPVAAVTRAVVLRAPRGNPVGRRRLALGWGLALLVPALLGVGLHLTRDAHALSTVVLLFLAVTVGVALVGGLRPAVVSALLGGLLSNYLFTEPYYTLRVDAEVDVVTVLALVLVAVVVATAVDRAARATTSAARSRAEADVLTSFAHAVLSGRDGVSDLLEQLRTTLGLDGVDLVRREARTGGDGTPIVSVGRGAPEGPGRRTVVVDVDDATALRLAGPRIGASDLRVVGALATQVAAVLERDRLRQEARSARGEKERTRTRTALLAAVSHDLRTPLAGIKAGVSTLRSRDIPLAPGDRDALLADVDASTDRLQLLIDDLLDMSRLDAGAVVPRPVPTAVEDLVAGALSGIAPGRVEVDVPDDLPLLEVDGGLLERAVANVAENAVRHGGDAPVRVSAAQVPGALLLRVADGGPGVPASRRADMFAPFRRLGDTGRAGTAVVDGVGLGLAVARGLTEVSGGTLEAEDTPGGGLTMVFRLPLPGPPSGPETGASA